MIVGKREKKRNAEKTNAKYSSGNGKKKEKEMTGKRQGRYLKKKKKTKQSKERQITDGERKLKEWKTK